MEAEGLPITCRTYVLMYLHVCLHVSVCISFDFYCPITCGTYVLMYMHVCQHVSVCVSFAFYWLKPPLVEQAEFSRVHVTACDDRSTPHGGLYPVSCRAPVLRASTVTSKSLKRLSS